MRTAEKHSHNSGYADNSGGVTFSDVTSVLANFNNVCP